MRVLMLCADWGLPYHGPAGSSVHFRCMVKAFNELGHETRSLVAHLGEARPDNGPPLQGGVPRVVPKRLWWPRVRGFIERLRGAEAHRTVTAPDTVAAPVSVVPAQPARPKGEDRRPSLRSRLYYDLLPGHLDAIEELVCFRRRFGRAAARLMDEFRPDFVYERYALGQTGGWSAARARSLPFLLEVNASLVRERASSTGLPMSLKTLLRRDETKLWRKADAVFCVSERLREQALACGAKADRAWVLPNGVDVEQFSPERGDGSLRRLAGDNDVLIGWIGSLTSGRGGRRFLSLLPPLLHEEPRAVGVVIGGGPLLADMRAYCRETGIADRVHFTGPVPHEQAPALLADLDIGVVSYPPRRDFYFSPMKLYEYMACGLAVVAGNMGQMAEALEHGVSGMLVDADEDRAWVQALAVLCRDPQLRRTMGAAARRAVVAHNSWKKNARTVTEIAASILATGGPR